MPLELVPNTPEVVNRPWEGCDAAKELPSPTVTGSIEGDWYEPDPVVSSRFSLSKRASRDALN
jgi:hypothetical protein